ncbi:MAG: tRNA lysidine(34) synthetase TilS [Thermostichus sp. DG02_3_bins_51]
MARLSPLHLRVQRTIRQKQLLHPGQRLLVGLSGGQDSFCVLKILQDLQPRWGWELFVLHCDHRWSEAETDCARFLQGWLEQQGLPHAVATADPIRRDEAGARAWRYQQLSRWARTWNCSAVVAGHTASDRAETFLFNLLRGTGVGGLTSLDWQRPLDARDPHSPSLVRPLLAVSRQETEQFCQAYSLPVWPDPSNQDLSHTRNRLRLEVIPYLQKHLNPQLEAALNRVASLLEAEHELVLAQAAQLWPTLYQPDPPRLLRDPLRKAPLALQRQILFQFLEQTLPHHPTFTQVEAAIRLLPAGRGSRTPDYPGGGWLQVEGDCLLWREGRHQPEPLS